MKIIRKKSTFCFMTKNKDYILQFTAKEPWLLPKHDPNYAGICNLYGWLFMYFGWYHEGLARKEV
jgi:hypothetical protein